MTEISDNRGGQAAAAALRSHTIVRAGAATPRLVVALVWLFQGAWCKLIAVRADHLDVVRGVPITAGWEQACLAAIGLGETALAVWVLCGVRPRTAAAAQTILLIAMNACGLAWAADRIPDPAGMIVSNLVFLTLVWIAARPRGAHREQP